MHLSRWQPTATWPAGRLFLFRFLFSYLFLYMAPVSWFNAVPLLTKPATLYSALNKACVFWVNANLFHFREHLVPVGVSGDTSFAWVQLFLYLLLALSAAALWTALNRRREAPVLLLYFLQLFTRYYIASIAVTYGLVKIFSMQMPEPSLSQMATPLGNLSSMRLLWLSIGYAPAYEVFLGSMELLSALLLFNRRTVTAGLLLACALFINISLMNLTYDVGVKLFSLHLLGCTLYLLWKDRQRLLAFFILNRPVESSAAFSYPYTNLISRKIRTGLKISLLILIFAQPVLEYGYLIDRKLLSDRETIFGKARYIVASFSTVGTASSRLKENQWHDMIFDDGHTGSVDITDAPFKNLYGRGYFSFSTDSLRKVLLIKGFRKDTLLHAFTYQLVGHDQFLLTESRDRDTLVLLIKKDKHTYELNKKSFHWVMEAGR